MDDSLHNLTIPHEVNGISPSQLTARPTPAGTVVSRIEGILESIIDRMSAEEDLKIDFVVRRSGRRQPQQIQFPGRTLQEAKKFARALLILQLAHDALVSGTILTKRHIFYQHQDLFEKQRTVDELVDDVALTLGINRDDLNIVASARGVFSGPLTIRLDDCTVIGSSLGDAGTALPATRLISRIDYGGIRWVLVIEKDAIFRSLTSIRFWQTSRVGPGLLITARGYPDVITRSFLHLVHMNCPQLPVVVLSDFDPDGLNIFRCYRFRSDNMVQGMDTDTPGMRWLGIKSQQILELDHNLSALKPSLDDSSTQESQSSEASIASRGSISSTDCRDPISHLTPRDRKTAVGILERISQDSSHDHEASELRRELQLMLMMGIKAEIQWLDDAGSITDWLDTKLGQMLSDHQPLA